MPAIQNMCSFSLSVQNSAVLFENDETDMFSLRPNILTGLLNSAESLDIRLNEMVEFWVSTVSIKLNAGPLHLGKALTSHQQRQQQQFEVEFQIRLR